MATCGLGMLITFVTLGLTYADDLQRKYNTLCEDYKIYKNAPKFVQNFRDVYHYHLEIMELSYPPFTYLKCWNKPFFKNCHRKLHHNNSFNFLQNGCWFYGGNRSNHQCYLFLEHFSHNWYTSNVSRNVFQINFVLRVLVHKKWSFCIKITAFCVSETFHLKYWTISNTFRIAIALKSYFGQQFWHLLLFL